MKTDLKVLMDMFTRAGVVFTTESDAGGAVASVKVEARAGPNNLGYIGFSASFDFDSTGKLVNVGAWE